MPPPGTTVEPRRYLPRFHWELLACGVSGHELVGTDAAHLREQDSLVAREMDGVRAPLPAVRLLAAAPAPGRAGDRAPAGAGAG
jgi:hypothetical protein